MGGRRCLVVGFVWLLYLFSSLCDFSRYARKRSIEKSNTEVCFVRKVERRFPPLNTPPRPNPRFLGPATEWPAALPRQPRVGRYHACAGGGGWSGRRSRGLAGGQGEVCQMLGDGPALFFAFHLMSELFLFFSLNY